MNKRSLNKSFYYFIVTLTSVATLIAILANLAKYISPLYSGTIAFCGLIMPAILVCNLTLLIIWISLRSKWSILPLLSLLINLGYINSVYQFSNSNIEQKTENEASTIATYNVQSFNNSTINHTAIPIKDFLIAQDTDIVCFQEFGINNEVNADSLKEIFRNWEYSAIPIPSNKYELQLAIFSKYPIINAEVFRFKSSSNRSMCCDIKINNDTVRLYNVHLQTTSINELKKYARKSIENKEFSIITVISELKRNYYKRAIQADFLAKHIKESKYPTVLSGDFNSLPSSYSYHQIKKAQLNDGFISSGNGYMYTYRYMKRLLRIDYIMHSEEINSVDYYLKDIDYSDHNPIIMKFDIKNGS